MFHKVNYVLVSFVCFDFRVFYIIYYKNYYVSQYHTHLYFTIKW